MLYKKKVTMKDVAKQAGVALGTLDRVLNSTGYVSEKKRKAVLQAVKELDYIPNRVASALSKSHEVNIAVIYPNVERYFWEQIDNGIRKAEKHFEAYGLRVDRKCINCYDETAQENAIRELLEYPGIQGLAIAPVHPSKLNIPIGSLIERGVAVATFDSDAPKSGRISFVGEDSIKGGRIAGKLMALFLGGKGRVVVLRAHRDMLAIQQRISGFVEKITNEFPDIEITKFYDMHDDQEDCEKCIYKIMEDILKSDRPETDGIFVTNALVGTVGKAIKELGSKKDLKLIGFDFSDDIRSLISDGTISATICTDLESEGYSAIKLLYEYIMDGKQPENELIVIGFNILMKETL